jgi:hypothetical protein
LSRIQSCLRHRIETRLSDQQTAEYGSPVPSVLLQASSSPRQFSFTIISLVECSFPKSAQLLLRLIILREGFVCSKPSVCSYFCKQICKGGRVFCVRTFFPRNRAARKSCLLDLGVNVNQSLVVCGLCEYKTDRPVLKCTSAGVQCFLVPLVPSTFTQNRC